MQAQVRDRNLLSFNRRMCGSFEDVAFFFSKKRSRIPSAAVISPLLVTKECKKKSFYLYSLIESGVPSLVHLPRVTIFYFFMYVMKGFVDNFCIFSVGTCMGFFKKNGVVSPTINLYGLIGFTTQKYTHFFGKWVALTHSTYGHTLYTTAKSSILTS